MKNKIITLTLLALFCFPLSLAQAKEKQPPYIDQQMILMGLYIYGVNQEASQNVPDLSELNFLADSLMGIISQIQRSKKSPLFHKKLNALIDNTQKLKKVTKQGNIAESVKAAKMVIKSCGSCHQPGAKKHDKKNTDPTLNYTHTSTQ